MTNYFEVGGQRVPVEAETWPVRVVETVLLGDSPGNPIYGKVDVTTLPLGFGEQRIRNGETWYAMKTFSGVADNASAIFEIDVGEFDINAIFCVTVSGAALVSLIESITSSGGTQVPVYNMLRSYSGSPPDVACLYSPTISNGVSIIDERFIPGGALAPVRIGAEFCPSLGRIIAKDTKYAIKCKNISGAAIYISVECYFYEIQER